MPFFLAPVYALFSKEFYKWAAASRFWNALKSLLFLGVITSALMTALIISRGLPVVDDFVGWVASEMPILQLTGEGLMMNEESPLTLVHPEIGALIEIDTSLMEVPPERLQDVYVFISADRVYIRQRGARVRTYQFFGPGIPVRDDAAGLLTPESILKFYNSVKPWFLTLFIFVYFVFFIAWKLISALFYSWIGLLINMGRREQLTFGAVYIISIYAMTASIVFQWMRTLLPLLNTGFIPALMSLILTTGYLFFGIRKTESAPA